jgi:protein-tyrosine phosphatase
MSFLSRLFRSEKPGEPIDLATLGVDMHSHFIPGIDDGAKTMKDSMEMITTMAELGYRKVITTPHIMGDFYQHTGNHQHRIGTSEKSGERGRTGY